MAYCWEQASGQGIFTWANLSWAGSDNNRSTLMELLAAPLPPARQPSRSSAAWTENFHLQGGNLALMWLEVWGCVSSLTSVSLGYNISLLSVVRCAEDSFADLILAVLILITLSLVIFRLWYSNKVIIKKNRAEDGEMHWPCPIITNCLDTRAKNHLFSLLREVGVCVQALRLCFCLSVRPGTTGMFNMGKSLLSCPGMAGECSSQGLVCAEQDPSTEVYQCLQKEIAGAPLLGLAETELEKAAGNDTWYGRNNIVAAREWIRSVKRFFHFLTSVISCARDDLNFFFLNECSRYEKCDGATREVLAAHPNPYHASPLALERIFMLANAKTCSQTTLARTLFTKGEMGSKESTELSFPPSMTPSLKCHCCPCLLPLLQPPLMKAPTSHLPACKPNTALFDQLAPQAHARMFKLQELGSVLAACAFLRRPWSCLLSSPLTFGVVVNAACKTFCKGSTGKHPRAQRVGSARAEAVPQRMAPL